MRPIPMKLATVAVAAAMLIAACGNQRLVETVSPTASDAVSPTTSTVSPDDEIGRLSAARRLWSAAGIDTYTYRFLDDCGECDQPGERSLVVWDGTVADPLDRAVSIDEAFDLIDAALASGRTVDVEYHPELGHPTDLWIDPDARAYDGGTHLVFGSVEPGLPGAEASLAAHLQARSTWQSNRPEAYEYGSAVVCDCEFQVEMRTRVIDGLVTEFETRTPEPTDITFSPLTIDQMFDDVEAMLSGETIDAGYFVTGTALYDERYGHPIWIGLRFEVIDADAASQQPLPDRLVMTVNAFEPFESTASAELTEARAKWDAGGLDSYVFEIVFHDIEAADFTDAFSVEVSRGEIVAVVQNGYDHGPDGVEGVGTIDDLFAEIDAAQRAGRAVDVIYDAELGYPSVMIFRDPAGGSGVSVTLRR